MENDDDRPSDDERDRRIAALDKEAAERDQLFNAALIEHGMRMPVQREGEPRARSARGIRA